MTEGRKVLACNYIVGTKVCSEGAKAYVLSLNYGNAMEEIWILARSHGGRWISKWERAHRLHNFRIKNIPPENSMYDRLKYAVGEFEDADEVRKINERADDIRRQRHTRLQVKADIAFALSHD